MTEESNTEDARNRSNKILATTPLSVEMEAAIKKIVDRSVQAHKTRIDDLEAKIERLIANQNRNTDNTENNSITSTANDGNGSGSGNDNDDDHGNDQGDDDDKDDDNDNIDNDDIDNDDGKDEDKDAWNPNNNVVPAETAVQEESTPHFSEMKRNIERIDLEAKETRQLILTHKTETDEEIRLLIAYQNTNNSSVANNSASTSTNNNGDINDVIKSKLFTDSSHQYLFKDTIKCSDGTSFQVGCHHRIIALLVIGFQYFSYLVIFILILHDLEVFDKESASATLEIDPRHCWRNTGYLLDANITAAELPGLLQCSNPAETYDYVEDFWIAVLLSYTGFSLLLFFVLPDLFEVFILFRCGGWKGKLAGVLIFFKAFLACFVGSFGTWFPHDGLLNAFFVFVGVIFVHEIDEQFGYLQDVMEQVREHYRCVSLQFGVLVVVLFFIPFVYADGALWNFFTATEGWNWLEKFRELAGF